MIVGKRNRSEPRIAVIGAGFGGITMAVRLRQAGFDDFVVLDAADGPGGTWWLNTYPGCEVDVHSLIYAFPFKRFDWSRTHARQPELARYMEETLDEFRVREHFRFGVTVVGAQWVDDSHWLLTLNSGQAEVFDVVISAVGMLSDPKKIDWPGVDNYRGVVFHSSRWRHDVDLAGKRVAVVGVGSTAAQIVPAIAADAKKVYVFQREPGWVLPKGGRDYSLDERRALRRPIVWHWKRLRLLAQSEWQHTYQPFYVLGSKRNRRGEAAARAYIEKTFANSPKLRAMVTPAYPFGGKRRVVADDFYPALLRSNVELVPHAVARLTATGIVDSTGMEHPADVVVAATGFKAADFLSSLQVIGRGRVSLRDLWRDGAYAFLGIAVPGFPNFYLMYGPNTNGGGPISLMHDRQAKYIVRNLRLMRRRRGAVLDVRPRYVNAYNSWIQSRMSGTAWLAGNNYFKGPQGQVVTQWRDGLILYEALIRIFRRPATRVIRSGSRWPRY